MSLPDGDADTTLRLITVRNTGSGRIRLIAESRRQIVTSDGSVTVLPSNPADRVVFGLAVRKPEEETFELISAIHHSHTVTGDLEVFDDLLQAWESGIAATLRYNSKKFASAGQMNADILDCAMRQIVRQIDQAVGWVKGDDWADPGWSGYEATESFVELHSSMPALLMASAIGRLVRDSERVTSGLLKGLDIVDFLFTKAGRLMERSSDTDWESVQEQLLKLDTSRDLVLDTVQPIREDFPASSQDLADLITNVPEDAEQDPDILSVLQSAAELVIGTDVDIWADMLTKIGDLQARYEREEITEIIFDHFKETSEDEMVKAIGDWDAYASNVMADHVSSLPGGKTTHSHKKGRSKKKKSIAFPTVRPTSTKKWKLWQVFVPSSAGKVKQELSEYDPLFRTDGTARATEGHQDMTRPSRRLRFRLGQRKKESEVN